MNRIITTNSLATSAIEGTANIGMAFHHSDGLVPAWLQAATFAGAAGHIATLPEIINARLSTTGLATCSEQTAWNSYFTTTSAEYCGVGKDGKRKIIVAHGVGPMATLEGVQQAYSFQYKDATRNNRGGRISRAEFLKLESGFYGEVAVVDFDDIINRYQYPFLQAITLEESLADPLVKARLGCRYSEYLQAHALLAVEYYRLRDEVAEDEYSPYVVEMNSANNCSYMYTPVGSDMAIAHLLSIGQLSYVSHSLSGHHFSSLLTDVSCHEWWDGVRLAAAKSDAPLAKIHIGVSDVRGLMHRNWQHVMENVSEPSKLGLRALTLVGDKWFTQYPKQGESMDTYEAEFRLCEIEPVTGGPETFTTTEGGGFFFKYGIKEVERIVPIGANAYYLSGAVERGGLGMIAPIQFFRIEVDSSCRMPRQAAVQNNYDLLMQLLELDERAE